MMKELRKLDLPEPDAPTTKQLNVFRVYGTPKMSLGRAFTG